MHACRAQTCRDADTKKNCCFSRSSLPYSVASLGYSTALMSSAFRLSSTAYMNRAIHQYLPTRATMLAQALPAVWQTIPTASGSIKSQIKV